MSESILSETLQVVVISHNCCDLTLQCIQSVLDTCSNISPFITLVDNASDDDTVSQVKKIYPQVDVISNSKNLGYAKAVNIGVKSGTSKYVQVTNNDVIFEKNSIQKLINFLEENVNAGAVGPQQIFPNKKWQRSFGDSPGIYLGIKQLFLINSVQQIIKKILWNNFNIHGETRKVGYIDGAVIAFKRDAYNSVNGFDEDYFFYTEELDFCYRLKEKKWGLFNLPSSVVIHYRGISTNTTIWSEHKTKTLIESKILFCKKHRSKFSTRFYIWCEIRYTAMMVFLWKAFSFFVPKQKKEICKGKIITLKLFLEEWKDVYH